MRYSFSGALHARPAGTIESHDIVLSSGRYQALRIPPATLAASVFACDFETALARLAQLERMFCEPDGSFVWTANDAGGWQVEGNLYDRAGRLAYVDVAGQCPPAQFDNLLTALGWPQTPLVFQLRREAVVLAEQEFRRLATASGGS